MANLILSGVGGSTNWLPLIFPLVVIVLLAKGGELIIRLVKKRREAHQRQIDALRAVGEHPDPENTTE